MATDYTQVLLALLNVIQTLALAVMADRSRRVRRAEGEVARHLPRRSRRRATDQLHEPPA